ncbi:hypothetical protein HYFRA_00011213 [Hymenoscyphus fraxineus]|uniref:Peptidase S54 rhomboid domain-containing protein n=1 Tax=Hymenoscyphus fraxineus TaxID=746836 RepID=A0A9N9PK95_9HELO|nr:hypothetical protein HYFRA_00011213 [Hymenoscyphus fraxineus]
MYHGTISTIILIGGCCSLWGLHVVEGNLPASKRTSQGYGKYRQRNKRTLAQRCGAIVGWLKDRDKNFYFSRRNVDSGRWWVMITSTVAHDNTLLRLTCNMLAALLLLPDMIRTAGYLCLITVWLIAGVGSSLPNLYWPQIKNELPPKLRSKFGRALNVHRGWDYGGIGASGALCGILGFLGVTSSTVLLVFAILHSLFGVFCIKTGIVHGTAHLTHIIGVAIGMLLGLSFLGWEEY